MNVFLNGGVHAVGYYQCTPEWGVRASLSYESGGVWKAASKGGNLIPKDLQGPFPPNSYHNWSYLWQGMQPPQKYCSVRWRVIVEILRWSDKVTIDVDSATIPKTC